MVIGRLGLMRPIFLALFTILGACSTTVQGPDRVLFASDNYEAVFNLAVQSAKSQGFNPTFQDRRLGKITTQPTIGSSFLEPWELAGSTGRQTLSNTLALQRRTVTFEFYPATTSEKTLPSDKLTGPYLLAPTEFNFLNYKGQIELRALVSVERKHTRDSRRSSQTLASTSVAQTLPRQGSWEQVSSSFWTPIARDIDQERSLLSAVAGGLKAN